MRDPALRALLVAAVALVLIASAGVVSGGAVTTPSTLGASDTLSDASVDGDAPRLTESIERRSETERQQTDGGITSASATRIRLDLNPDRSADWTVAVRYSLADENETAAFETAGDQFRAGEIGPSAELFEGFRRETNRNVDRSMVINGVDREVILHEDPGEFPVATEEAVAVGELRLTFTWTEFLAQDGESLVLGDALMTPGNETWLRNLESGQTLEVGTPEGYTVTGTPSTAVAQLSDGDVIIEGPQTFDGGEPVAIVYGPTETETSGPPWEMLTAAVLFAAVLVAGVVFGYRRVGDGGVSSDDGAAGGDRGRAPDGESAGQAGDGGVPGDAVDGGEADEPDLSLLSDEERVERLLDENGGRMRQADIVAETGWSDAKVSQLLSAMADEGRVEKLRLGRENLISLPDEESESGDGDRADG